MSVDYEERKTKETGKLETDPTHNRGTARKGELII